MSILSATVFYAVFIARTGFYTHGQTYFTLFDDAMISMRYARNLAEGNGLVWNSGEAPVEGYTNFLWTIWMALLHLMPVSESHICVLVMASSALALLTNIWIVKLVAERISQGSFFVTGMSLILVAFYYPLVYWSLRGMEAGLLTLVIDSAVLLAFQLREEFHPRKLLLLCSVLGTALLIRSDAAVSYLIISCFAALSVPEGDRRKAIRMLMITFAVTLGVQLLFRLAYYGDFLPNTYYLKLAGRSFSERILRGGGAFTSLLKGHLYPLSIPILGLLPLRGNRCKTEVLLLLSLFIGQCSYSIFVGGDGWEEFGYSNRYICIAVPALIIAASQGSREIMKMLAPKLTLGGTSHFLLTAATSLLLWFPSNFAVTVHWIRHNAIYVENYDFPKIRLGLIVREGTQPGATIAVGGAGTAPYFFDRRAIDLLGKSDRKIARERPKGSMFPGHDKWDYQYSIGTFHPDVITDLWRETPHDIQYIAGLGYQKLPNGIYINRASHLVDPKLLSRKYK